MDTTTQCTLSQRSQYHTRSEQIIMTMIKTLVFLVSAAVLALAADEEVVKRATVRLEAGGVSGNITFTALPDGNVHITGRVIGMPPGMYGFHIHEKGDLTGGCDSTLGHFNPNGHDHGHPHDEHRHVGDLGNIQFNKAGVADVDFKDHEIKLFGRHNIIGRALVLRSDKDDYGQTDHPLSKVEGNPGARVACGVIGIA